MRGHLKLRQRMEAAALYGMGFSPEEIGKKFGKSKRQMERIFKQMGVERGFAQAIVDKQITEAIAKEAAARSSEIMKKIQSTRDDSYRTLTAINRLVAHTMAQAKADGKDMASTLNAARALLTHAQAVKVTLDGRFKALGVKEDGNADNEDLPTLSVQEMTEEDVRRVQAAADAEDDPIGALSAMSSETAQAPRPAQAPEATKATLGEDNPPLEEDGPPVES